jgi:hypothetical protein
LRSTLSVPAKKNLPRASSLPVQLGDTSRVDDSVIDRALNENLP